MSIETLTGTILRKMSFIGKWQAKFFIELGTTWLSLKGRYTFENLSRQGNMSSESYRSNFLISRLLIDICLNSLV